MKHYEELFAEYERMKWDATATYQERHEALHKANLASKFELAVGDGVTINLYTDRHAATVIKRTPKTITVRRDKATLKEGWKPNFVVGGFSAHCTNQNEQEYTYSPDPEGELSTFHWSERDGEWYEHGYGSYTLSRGRREFYDYNF